LENWNPATAIYWFSPFVYRMLGLIMGHGRRCNALLNRIAVGLVSVLGGAAPALVPARFRVDG
jgi:hypothetical protein